MSLVTDDKSNLGLISQHETRNITTGRTKLRKTVISC